MKKVDVSKGWPVKCLENCIISLDDVQSCFDLDDGTNKLMYELKERLLFQLRCKYAKR